MIERNIVVRQCLGKDTALARGEIERGHIPWNKGEKLHYEVWNKGLKGYMAGPKNGNWKGGKTALMDAIRTCSKYKKWRGAVFKRDDYRCVLCGKDGRLQADHVVPLAALVDTMGIKTLEKALKMDKLFDIENGRTLCIDCHRKTDTFGVNFIRWEKCQDFL